MRDTKGIHGYISFGYLHVDSYRLAYARRKTAR